MSKPSNDVRRTSTELEFLPAHLELIERPVSHTARALAGTLCALLCVGLAWSYVGQIDIVASAPGRVVATSRSKTIQSMETALVRRVHVTDGDVVRVGAPLIDLDDTAAVADRIKAGEALAAAQRMVRRQTLLLGSLDRDAWATDVSAPDEPTRLAQLDHAQYVARKRALAAIATQRRGEAATVKGQLGALAEAATISARRSTDTGKLIAAGHVARHEFLQREQERIDAGRVARAQVGHAAELDAAADAADRDLQTHVTTTRQQAADQLRESSESATQFRQDLASAEQRIRQLHLVAPVDGTVQQLATHTVGGVVTPGQPLLSIVPDGDPLEVEATVLNQDIGFVRPGQPVTIKIETFPYTRYGFVQGHVETVSHDAAQDEKLGLVFPARVRLESSRLRIDGVDVSLSPGMAVTAEVKTGRRRLINYLLGPLQEQMGEAARER